MALFSSGPPNYRSLRILLVYSIKEPRNGSWNQFSSSDGCSFGPFRHARRINQQYRLRTQPSKSRKNDNRRLSREERRTLQREGRRRQNNGKKMLLMMMMTKTMSTTGRTVD